MSWSSIQIRSQALNAEKQRTKAEPMIEPAYFRRRAEALRARASLAGSPAGKAWLLNGAAQYEQLAADKLDASAVFESRPDRAENFGELAK